MRLFIGIPLADEVAGELMAVRARLRPLATGLRWPEPESWHITLQFLGSVGGDGYGRVTQLLGELRSAPVEIVLEGLGCFERAGVIYAAVKLTAELDALQQSVAAAMTWCGLTAEERPFQPHITLARGKGRDARGAMRSLRRKIHPQPAYTRFVAREILLYESVPGSVNGSSGTRYLVLNRYPLTGGRPPCEQANPHAKVG